MFSVHVRRVCSQKNNVLLKLHNDDMAKSDESHTIYIFDTQENITSVNENYLWEKKTS